jgi:hypothetical protein
MALTRYYVFYKRLGHFEPDCITKNPTNKKKLNTKRRACIIDNNNNNNKDNKNNDSLEKKLKKEDSNKDVNLVAFSLYISDIGLACNELSFPIAQQGTCLLAQGGP